MKSKKNQRKHRSQKRNRVYDPGCDKVRFCDPGACPNCQYIGEGDFICDRNNVIVVSDWEPTDEYMSCRSHSSFRPQERQKKTMGRKPATRRIRNNGGGR